MRLFNFCKTTPRNNFTTIFGRVGKRRTLFIDKRSKTPKRFLLKMYRRAAQGWRNKRIGSIQALKIRLQYGRRTPTRRFVK